MKKPKGRPPHDDVLTPAEWRIFDACRHGLSNQKIAAGYHISINAVKYHVKNILAKTGRNNKKELRTYDLRPKGDINPSLEISYDGISALGQISRSVENLAASVNWYSLVLELPHLFSSGGMAFFECNGVRLMLMEKKDDVNSDESILYFAVTDISRAYATLSTKGVECIAAPHKIHTHQDGSEEWMAFIKDLEGRPLGIMERTNRTNPS